MGGRFAYLIAFVDDYSRHIVGAELFRSPTAAAVIEVYRTAVGKYQPDLRTGQHAHHGLLRRALLAKHPAADAFLARQFHRQQEVVKALVERAAKVSQAINS